MVKGLIRKALFVLSATGFLSGTAHSQATYDMLVNQTLMLESQCIGSGGSWGGMKCSGGPTTGNGPGADWAEIGREIENWHNKEMEKATCLLIVSAARTPEDMAVTLSQHLSKYRPNQLHIFQENQRSFILTHGYTRILIGSSMKNRVRAGQIPWSASCQRKSYADTKYKLIASGEPTGLPGQYQWSGDMAFLTRFIGQ